MLAVGRKRPCKITLFGNNLHATWLDKKKNIYFF